MNQKHLNSEHRQTHVFYPHAQRLIADNPDNAQHTIDEKTQPSPIAVAGRARLPHFGAIDILDAGIFASITCTGHVDTAQLARRHSSGTH